MALGMAKDSMVDLQSLVQGKAESESGGTDTLSLLTTGQSKRCTSEYEKIAKQHDPKAVPEEEVPSVETEEATKARESLLGSPGGGSSLSPQPAGPQEPFDGEEEKKQDSYGQYAGFAYDYDSYSYDPYQLQYDRTPSILGPKKPSETSFFCCIFPWLGKKVADDPDDYGEPDKLMNQEKQMALADGSKPSTPLRKASSGGDDDDVSRALAKA